MAMPVAMNKLFELKSYQWKMMERLGRSSRRIALAMPRHHGKDEVERALKQERS